MQLATFAILGMCWVVSRKKDGNALDSEYSGKSEAVGLSAELRGSWTLTAFLLSRHMAT